MGTKSIDDILLSRYIGELSASYSIGRQIERSPYQLSLKHTNILASHRSLGWHSSRSQKPNSGKFDSQRSKSSEPGSFRQNEQQTNSVKCNDKKQTGENNHCNFEDDAEQSSTRSEDRRKLKKRPRVRTPSYLRIPEVYVVTAFKNGDRSASVRVSSPNFEKLLEHCTVKLGLPSSARKLFLRSGQEVPRNAALPRGTETYVSMGESFKDPAKLLEKRLCMGADVHWNLNGINLPSDREREVTKPASTPQGLRDVNGAKRRILIFANGKGVSGIEIVANLVNIDELKQNCTLKFNSGQHIKRILQLNGDDVEDLNDVPEVDPLLNNSIGTPLLGPVWASKGENISPMGVDEYLRGVIRLVKQKRARSKSYLGQLELAHDSENKGSLAKDERLMDKRILSMSDDELNAEIEKEDEKQYDYAAFLMHHRELLENIEPKVRLEQKYGSKYTMKHIAALPVDHSLVSGRPGLRVSVFMNGKDSDPVTAYFNMQEASRGLKKDKNRKHIVFQRFLDCLSANPLLANKNSKSKGILVRRVFTKTGTEITDAMTLRREQHVWISHGEDWIDPFIYCMQAEISKVTELVQEGKNGLSRAVVRSTELPQIDEKSSWRPHESVPEEIEQMQLPAPKPREAKGKGASVEEKNQVEENREEDDENEEEEEEDDFEEDDGNKEDGEEPQEEKPENTAEDNEEEATLENKPPDESVPRNSCFLQNSKNKRLCLFVEPVIGIQQAPKETPADENGKVKHVWPVWPRAGLAQIWVVHQTGQITLRNFKLALSVTDDLIDSKLQGAQMSGNIVQFSPFEEDEDQIPAAQIWRFSASGLIYSERRPELVLTYLGGLAEEPETRPKNELNDLNYGYRNMLAVCEPLESREDLDKKLRLQLEKHQHFGLRLSKFENFSTWRKAGEGDDKEKTEKHKDASWSKLALLWPTDKRGNWIKDLDWPLECRMLAFAPPLKEYKPKSDNPKRFICLKNGERNIQFSVQVTAPDLTNMKKQNKENKAAEKKRPKKADRKAETDSVSGDDYLHVPHCSDMTVRKVEFKIFLETCTSILGLSSAARRIFDEQGKEHESLDDLERDQVLYVSMGEPWSDPRYSKEQLEARSMLVKMAEDVDKIRSFVAMKKTAHLVITAESLAPGAKLGISRDILTRRERREKQLREAQSPPDAIFDSSDDEAEEQIEPGIGLSAHERACQRSDEKQSSLKWPWEKIVSNELDQVAEENSEQPAPAKASSKSHQQRRDLTLKQFDFEDGFIFSCENRDLVLTATDSGGTRVLDVKLQKRRPDNLYQRWQLTNTGLIALKYQSSSVLTIKLPKVTPFSSEPVGIESSILTVQPQKAHQFGRAHQLFALDQDRSTIRCFATNPLDISVTAANQSGCCSYYVTDRGEKLDQPGYVAYLPVGRKAESKMKACTVCVSCAKSLRGKYKLQKLVPGSNTDFACAFGQTTELGLQEPGSFKLLNSKIDLTDGEADATLKKWESEIQTQREKLSVKAIANRLSEAKTLRPIRVLAYRNGEGRLCKPVPIYGSSVQGIMDQCASKLGYSWPVRKLFLEDGTPVLDVHDLKRWCNANAKEVRKRQKEIDSGCLQPEMEEMRAEVAGAEKTKSPRPSEVAQPSGNQVGQPSRKPSVQRDDLEPRLKQRYFQIGSRLTEPTAYSLSVSLYSLNFLDEILPKAMLESGNTHMVVRYNIFGQTICTDLFANEDAFEGEKREIQIKSELPILRRFFNEKFRMLKFDLVRMPEETVLATSYVPMDTLVREEHEEFINSSKIAADYAWYKKTTEKPKGERTHASLHVEISITVSADVNVDNDDDPDSANASVEGASEMQPAPIATPEQTPAGNADAQVVSVPEASEPLDLQNLCIELWASTGDAFVSLPEAHQEFRQMLQQRKELREVLTTKEADKHVLKMMQGRRLQAQEPGKFRSTTDPEHPVVVEGGWKTPRGEEVMVEQEIRKLADNEAKIRTKHAAKPPATRQAAVEFDRQLYKQSVMQRLRVFQNGEDPKTATTVWAESVHQVLETATSRLGLRKPARVLFDTDGKDVHDFSQLARDQLLCVSCGEAYRRPGAVFENVEIKANWGRARRMYGAKSTNFQVLARGHPLVGVDPFGPPLHGAAKALPPPPAFDTRRVRVFENGRVLGEPESIFGDSLEALLKAATRQLKLRSPAICFFSETGHQIVTFSEISRDDLLFASTTSRGFIRSERP